MNDGRFIECLDYVHDVFFSDMETEMSGLIKALIVFEETCEYFARWFSRDELVDNSESL